MVSENIINKDKLSDVLSDDEFNYYFKHFKNGKLEYLDILVKHNIRFVYWYIDNNIKCYDIEYNEIFSVGLEALVEAVYKFDINKNIKFSTFAVTCIRNKICKYFRTENKHLKVKSLDGFISDSHNSDTYGDRLIDYSINLEDDFIEKDFDIYLKSKVIKILETFDELDKKIIMFSFGFYDNENYTQKEISDKLGISQSFVSKRLSRSLRNLRMQLNVIENKGRLKNKRIIKKVA